jgi:hypothetical protein
MWAGRCIGFLNMQPRARREAGQCPSGIPCEGGILRIINQKVVCHKSDMLGMRVFAVFGERDGIAQD